MSKESEDKIVVPDQLNITINTSIPGFQKIKYKPSMTEKNSKDSSVRFNPLVKLNKTLIDTIPKEYRIKEFFNEGLFQSLITRYSSIQSQSLTQATRLGYVDNNIKVTLDTIFPVGSVIYIGNSPYAIGDVQWTTGDWDIEVKQKKVEIDPNRVTDPYLYTQLVRDEIISGEEQLSRLPDSISRGPNFSGPIPAVARGVNKTASTPTPLTTPTPPIQPTPTVATSTVATSTVATPTVGTTPNNTTRLALPPAQPLTPLALPAPPPQKPQKVSELLAQQHKALLAQKNQPKKSPLTLPPPPSPPKVEIQQISPEEEHLFDNFKKDLIVNFNASEQVKKYFMIKNYYSLINSIYNEFSNNFKNEIQKFYFITTNYEPPRQTSNISMTSYIKLCEQVSILKAPQDGDCFFKAVADGINIYNYENQNSKIIYGIYGKTQLFTIAIMRDIVLKYFLSLSDDEKDDLLATAEFQLDDLNNAFLDSINGLKRAFNVKDLTAAQYMDQLINTYKMYSNFLIYRPSTVPTIIGEYEKPFRVLTQGEISAYFKSKDYWANNFAIEAVCNALKICVLPIENFSYQKAIKFKPVYVDRLRTILYDNDDIKDNCSKKVMFLYHKDNHYELMRFKYNIKPTIKILGKGVRKNIEYTGKWYSIFNKGDLIPPIHILFLLYGSSYSMIESSAKLNFGLYQQIMEIMDASVIKILNNPSKNQEFIRIFNDLFPHKKSILTLTTVNTSQSQNINDQNVITGGRPYYNQYQQPYYNQYQQPYYNQYGYPRINYFNKQPHFITKNPNKTSISKITYSINIDMELHPGTTLTPEQIQQSKCNNKYNAIRKAFSKFTGQPYSIPPVYYKTVKNKTVKNKKQVKEDVEKKVNMTRKNM